MTPAPPATKARRPILLVPGWKSLEAYTPDGVLSAQGPLRSLRLIESLASETLYVELGLKSLLRSTGAKVWQADLWKGRVTSLSLEGSSAKVTSLRGALGDRMHAVTEDTAARRAAHYEALLAATRWLGGEGVAPASISAMSWALWRRTLEAPLTLGFDPARAERGFYGPRQEAPAPGEHRDMVSLDIAQAYPHAMSSSPYAASLREVHRSTTLDPERAGFAQATVTVPQGSPVRPLPTRLGPEMIQWREGALSGTWTWRELAAAKSLGFTVDVSRCWAPLLEVQPFTQWYALYQRARRELAPDVLGLIKPIFNSLWGLFAMTDEVRGIIRWRDDLARRPELISRQRRRLPHAHALHIAAETTSRLRTRVLLEGIVGELDRSLTDAPAHIDTDGVIIPAAAVGRMTSRVVGDGAGQWRVKQPMYRVWVRGPQLFAFRCSPTCARDHDRMHYVAAGLDGEGAHQLFSRLPGGIAVSLAGHDAVAPGGPPPTDRDVREWQYQRMVAESALWGPTEDVAV